MNKMPNEISMLILLETALSLIYLQKIKVQDPKWQYWV